jgi:hypothetical protein
MTRFTYDPRTEMFTLPGGLRVSKAAILNMAGPQPARKGTFCRQSAALVADGFDDCIIGASEYQPGRDALVVYDLDKMVDVLVKRDKMARRDAEEYLAFNTVGAWVGDGTPVFIRRKPRGVPVHDWLEDTFPDDGK